MGKMSSSKKNITAENLKDKLFQSLKTRGVLDSLQSQLRKQLILELQDTSGLPVLRPSVVAPTTKSDKEDGGLPLFQKIANSIVAEYLKRCNYEYTLSTFLPESGTSSEEVFANKDILHLLHINPESNLYKNLEWSLSSSTGNKGFLWQFLVEITALHVNSKRDAENQTDEKLPTRASSLEEKLSSVEKTYSENLRLHQLHKNQAMEEKLIAVQKNYETQKRKELEKEIQKFRENEMSSLRLEERGKYEAEAKKIRQQYEQDFNKKSQALRAMENEMLERVQRLQEIHESEAFAERQKMLQEVHSLTEREAGLKSRIEVQQRSQKREEERLQVNAEQLQAVEDAFKEKKKFQESKMKTDMERFKTDYEQQHTARHQELLRLESRLEAERSRLESEKEKYAKSQEHLTSHTQKIVELESRLLLENMNKQKVAVEDKLSGMKDYQALKEKELSLRKDIEHLTQRLEETNVYWKEQEKKQQNLVKELTAKHGKAFKQVLGLRKEIKDVKEKCICDERSSNEAQKTVENRLAMEIQRANHFQELYEEQLSSQRLMMTEIEDLKTMLQQADQLVCMELRQQKTNNSAILQSSRSKRTLRSPSSHQQAGHEFSTRTYDADESSTVDESSLVSLTEDKKVFEKLEREAEALDASYRNFQHRIRATQQHAIGSVASSMSFHRLPSYYSFHSPENVTNSRGVRAALSVAGNKVEFHPLTLLNESGTLDHLKPSVMTRRHSDPAVTFQSSQQDLSTAKIDAVSLKALKCALSPISKLAEKFCLRREYAHIHIINTNAQIRRCLTQFWNKNGDNLQRQ